jgi:glyoxylase-like metal-dependent hydrolase (beta-lactamase superfamily II)
MPPLEALKDLLFFERGYLCANHLAWRAERPVLIDTGYLACLDQTLALLRQAGVDAARTGLIVNTHCHCDHVGGNRRLQGMSGCRVAMHPLGKLFMETVDDWSTWWRYYGQEAEFSPCDQALADGETLAIGPHEFRVIHTPGHAADGLALYHPGAKLLISSDALWETDMAVVTERVEGSAAVYDWLESLERLAGLQVRLVLPGHGRPFTDFAGALARARARLRRYLADRRELGRDQLRRILVYTLLMRGPLPPEGLLALLQATPWFPETCAHYFDGDQERLFRDTVSALLGRDVLRLEEGKLLTMVKP